MRLHGERQSYWTFEKDCLRANASRIGQPSTSAPEQCATKLVRTRSRRLSSFNLWRMLAMCCSVIFLDLGARHACAPRQAKKGANIYK